MEIKYNNREQTIEINDGLKNQYFLIKILVVFMLFNSIIQLVEIAKKGFGFEEYFWLVIGLISLFCLYLIVYKLSTADKISITEINTFEEKSIFGHKRLALRLKNGKQRNLAYFKDDSEIAKARQLFSELGISATR